MKTKITLLVITLIVIWLPVSADEIWKGYQNGNTVLDTAFQGDYVWCAAEGSLVRWNKRDGTYKQYTTEDGLLSNRIHSVFVDRDDNLWIGSLEGAQRYNGVVLLKLGRHCHRRLELLLELRHGAIQTHLAGTQTDTEVPGDILQGKLQVETHHQHVT